MSHLSNVVSAISYFKEYLKENEETMDENSKAVILDALSAARAIIYDNRKFFTKEELKSLLKK